MSPATGSGGFAPARIDEKLIPEKERRPMASAFDKLVEVNLALTDTVGRLVRSMWFFMALQVLLFFAWMLLEGR